MESIIRCLTTVFGRRTERYIIKNSPALPVLSHFPAYLPSLVVT